MRHCTVANTVLFEQILDSLIVAVWMTAEANTRFCKIPEDVDGRSEAIVEVLFWRMLSGLAVAVFLRCSRLCHLDNGPHPANLLYST